jgi:hypothetical protein
MTPLSHDAASHDAASHDAASHDAASRDADIADPAAFIASEREVCPLATHTFAA